MKNGELRQKLASGSLARNVLIVNPGTNGEDYMRYSIGRVTFLLNSRPVETIIEASYEPETITVNELLGSLLLNDTDGDVQVFVKEWEGQQYAYFDIGEVREPGLVHLVLGAWRCGG